MKRSFDIVFSIFGLLFLSPVFLAIALAIKIDSKGSVFYFQERVGKDGRLFKLIKFRSMAIHADKLGLLTIGGMDARITKVGYYIRKYKLDEFPQLLNILKGEMSFVGPRPEVEKYVKLYPSNMLGVLKVKPGLTDLASIQFINENEILAKSNDPEKTYIQEIMPAKLELNFKYIQTMSISNDLKIIFKTLLKIFRF